MSNIENEINEINKYLEILKLNIKNKNDIIQDLKEQLDKFKKNNYLNCSEDIKNRDSIIQDLKEELDKVKKLLEKNATTVIKKEIDYTSCEETLNKFISVNDMFERKKQVISILEDIINNPSKITNFTNLNEEIKNNIKERFNKVKIEIEKYINELKLDNYVKSEYIKWFKTPKQKNIPMKFCEELNTISNYWDENIGLFREQDNELTNIYEDLSGAVRVYIRIKPLIGKSQKENTVLLQNNSKKVTIDCSGVDGVNKQQTFGEFYGIYNDKFTNKDAYVGSQGSGDIYDLNIDIDSIKENNETISPGLYSTFKQVENGYSIVLFGYGLSGSGKTYSLLGEKGVPGIIHYGLANLRGVKNIKIKYLFEEYIDKITSTTMTLEGKIINLVGKPKKLTNIDEIEEFNKKIEKINLNDIKIENINKLTEILETYRIDKKRVKKTPNNPVSSRSHLYMVFEITFDSNKTGYITVVDTAGRESPIDIFNMFIGQKKMENGRLVSTSLTTILGPTGDKTDLKEYIKPEYRSTYKKEEIIDILREGIYINETINHLIYFFNQKNYKKTEIKKIKEFKNYNNNNYFVSPLDIKDNFVPILMIPILKFLDNLGKDDKNTYKPTKFITLVCVRQDIEYCSQIFGTLEFAEKIKSS